MKSLSILLVFLFVGCGQEMHKEQQMKLNWDVDSVIFYGFYERGEMKRVTEKDLQSQKGIIIKDERLTALFRSAKYDERWSVWKGGHLGVVYFKDGFKMKIAISHYGGYFHIMGQTGFYFFENQDRELWEYLFFGEGLQESIRKSKSD